MSTLKSSPPAHQWPAYLEELGHRDSFDLDFHTFRALQDVRPILAEMETALSDQFELVETPDELGSGFEGVLTLPDGGKVAIQVLSNYESVSTADLVSSRLEPDLKRVSLKRYVADKIQCVADRAEARDLIDIHAVLQQHRNLEPWVRKLLAQQDAVLLVQRLQKWTDDAVVRDLKAYPGVSVAGAIEIRDRLLRWVRS
ncbi:MAG: nucleotidyl transferase AbiEii/AbiGii toxin family protein [Candidatus Xenobia bacterium]